MNKNNNIATIYHDRHDQLKLLVGSPAKAEFLSKCIYWWQISKYKIKNSDYIWFTRTTDELAAGAALSESSVGRYLRDFSDKGLIEKRVIKRFSRKHDQDIACLHIRITNKLVALLKTITKKPSTTNQTTNDKEHPDSKNLGQLDDTPSVNLTVPTINNKENSSNNNINTFSQDVVNCGKKQKAIFEKTIFPIEKEIGERISEEIKDQIKGMLYNVLKQQGQELKHNERLFTEVLFALINPAQFKSITCMNHRLNIAASLIRKKQWRTPKGFYKYWDIGQAYKACDEVKTRLTQQDKLTQELLGVTDPKRRLDNTFSQDVVNCGKKQKAIFEKTIFPIEKEIGERISEEIKDQIKGMLYNVLKQQGQELKHNERLFTEVLFALINPAQFKSITCMNHRLNIAASLIRKKQWRTPKGFYKYWDIGQAYKACDEVKTRLTQQDKLTQELLGVTDPKRRLDITARFNATLANETRFSRPNLTAQQQASTHQQQQLKNKLQQVNQEISMEKQYLSQIEQAFKEHLTYASQPLVESIKNKLNKLYAVLAQVQGELQQIPPTLLPPTRDRYA